MTFSECMDLIKWARKRQEGQTMAEYAVILSVITAASLAALLLLSGNISTVINHIADFVK